MSIQLLINQSKQTSLKQEIRQLDIQCAALIKSNHRLHPQSIAELKELTSTIKVSLNQLQTLQTERQILLSRPGAYYLKACTSPLYLFFFSCLIMTLWGLWIA